ncbi:ywtG [Symbiodinium natans]|uniref:Hexose transporter 1 n=1 Tax=Symbiodinium natans TaxID=878477 RepID=A0A812IHA4_9DINO|nr:ywtG [Symbiodinium natans]
MPSDVGSERSDGHSEGPSRRQLLAADGLSLEADLKQLKRTVAIASLSTFCLGYNTAIVAGAQSGIHQDTSFVHGGGLASGVLVSSALPAAALGALGGQVANLVGRRKTLLAVAGLFALAPLAMAAAPSFFLLLVARSLCGISIGVSSVLTNLYITEVSPAVCRGRLGGWAPFIGTSGILVSYIVSSALQAFPNQAWRWQFGLAVLPALLQLLLNRHLPETPRWLLAQTRKEDARQCLQQLFPKAAQSCIEEELSRLEADLGNTAEVAAVSCVGLCHAEHRASTTVGAAINVLQQVSGINVFIYFAPQILEDAGFGRYSMISTVLVSLIQLTATAVLIQYIDRVGRRPLALIGLAGMMAGLLLVIAGSVQRGAGMAVAVTAWSSLLGMLLFRAAFSLSLGPLPYVMTSEFFKQEARAAGVGACWAMNWLANFAVSLSFPVLAEAASKSGPAPDIKRHLAWIPRFRCFLQVLQ